MCGNDDPVDECSSITRSNQVDILLICRWLLLQHLRDQLQDEADVVRLAPLVVHVPAFLVAVWSNYYCIVAEIIKSLQIA